MCLSQEFLSNFLTVGNAHSFQLSAVYHSPGIVIFTNEMWLENVQHLPENTVDRGTKSLPRFICKKSRSMAAVVMAFTTHAFRLTNGIRTKDKALACHMHDS